MKCFYCGKEIENAFYEVLPNGAVVHNFCTQAALEYLRLRKELTEEDFEDFVKGEYQPIKSDT